MNEPIKIIEDKSDARTPVQVPAQSKKKVKLPSYTGLRPTPIERHKVLPAWATLGLALIGIFVAVAFMADAFVLAKKKAAGAPPGLTPANLLLSVTQATNRYVDRDGRFTIAVPAGWQAVYGGTNVEYDALLTGPDRLRLQVIVGDAPLETLPNLKRVFGDIELETMRNTHIADMTFRGQPAISRYCRMDIDALRCVDFLHEGRAFHLMAQIPRENFESQRAVVDALMETIEPLPKR